MSVATDAGGLFALDRAQQELLLGRVGQAADRARRHGRPVLASLTVTLETEVDPAAAVFGARGQREWFCLEQPAREGFALAGLGAAALVEAGGPERFAEIIRRSRELVADAVHGDVQGRASATTAAGPVWVGGFAFAHDGGRSPEWSSLAPARLVMPELSLARRGASTEMTLNALVGADADPEQLGERLAALAASLGSEALPLVDPDPAVAPRVHAATPPAHYEGAVARAVERIAAGELTKVVLAREVRVHAATPIDPGAVFGALRAAFPECYCYCVGTPELAFTGASPELLVRRDGARMQTVALAGTTRRSADPAIDSHLGEQLLASPKNREEQAIVARRIERSLAAISVWVAAAEDPVLVKVQNVQHLATPIRAQLAEPLPAVELLGRLHPTPAVGGEPWTSAAPLIPALEGLDRGWYAGPIGWTDLAEDGEFCVGLRCALLRGAVAHLYAGDGIVRESVPAEELAETEVKLAALLPLLA